MIRRYIITLFIGLFLLTSCSKETLDACGTVTNGTIEFNEYIGEYEYYLYVDNVRKYVSEKIYSSYYIGDYVCLDY